jgi:hypothetical protein
VADTLLAALDGIQGVLWRAGVRFQWPCWLLDWAWSRQATPYPLAVRPQLEAAGDVSR